ncbi:MAG: phosphopentomutase [Verrucomicrobiota bacterium]
MKAYLIVLDSAGIGAAPDAAEYGDAGASTIPHTAAACNGLNLPFMKSLGLGNIPALIPGGLPIQGVEPADSPVGSYGAMQEMSCGKDTTTGHWEMAGLFLEQGFTVFPEGPPAFPRKLVARFESGTGLKILGNKAASGTEIIEELGQEHMRTGNPIVYTSADSVFQVAAHKEIIPLEQLYNICSVARELCNKYNVGRVIARPFSGEPGNFKRTDERKDYSLPPTGETILDRLSESGVNTVTVGKLDDIFAGQGISEALHVENNAGAMSALQELASRGAAAPTFVFANLVDFDMLYGHRRDPEGYGRELEKADGFLRDFSLLIDDNDVMLITADHGNDPTFRGTDHTREYTPLLCYCRNRAPAELGIRKGFYDIAQTLAGLFGAQAMERGTSFL